MLIYEIIGRATFHTMLLNVNSILLLRAGASANISNTRLVYHESVVKNLQI